MFVKVCPDLDCSGQKGQFVILKYRIFTFPLLTFLGSFFFFFFALEAICDELSGLQLACRLFDALCYTGKTCPSNLVYCVLHPAPPTQWLAAHFAVQVLSSVKLPSKKEKVPLRVPQLMGFCQGSRVQPCHCRHIAFIMLLSRVLRGIKVEM